jgi:hypothetical protein
MVSEGLSPLVAIEQRWKHAKRQGRRDEQRISLQRREDHIADLLGDRMAFG